MEYRYVAKNNKDKQSSGDVEAESKQEAIDLIEDMGLTVVSMEAKKKKVWDIQITFLEKVSVKDLVIFYRQLSMMITSEIPIVKALKIISSQTKNPKLQRILKVMYNDVQEGMKFSDAMAKEPDVFGEFYINMIRSGEVSGKFAEVLLYLADQQEKDYAFRAKLKGAMKYPIFILSALFGMGIIMMIFVVPKLTATLTSSGMELPPATKAMIFMSDTTKRFWYLIIGGVIGGLFAFKYVTTKIEFGKKIWHRVVLKIPKFGPDLVRKTYLIRLMKSLSLLVIGGVPLVKAIEITSTVIGNYHYEKLLTETAESVKDGNTIASVFMQHPDLIPPMITQMASIGEQTGKMHSVFKTMGDFYETEVDTLVEGISKLIEPIIMVIMGGAVGFLVISIMLPMFKMSDAM